MLLFRSYSTLIASRNNLRKAQDCDSVIDFTKQRINFERRALRLIYPSGRKRNFDRGVFIDSEGRCVSCHCQSSYFPLVAQHSSSQAVSFIVCCMLLQ